MKKEFSKSRKIATLNKIVTILKQNSKTDGDEFICNIAHYDLKIIGDNRIEEFKPIFPELYKKLDNARKKLDKYGSCSFCSSNYKSRIKLLTNLKDELEKTI